MEIAVKDIMRMERGLLETLATSYETHLDNLGKYDLTVNEFDKNIASYRDFIIERILWIQSSTFSGLFDYKPAQATAEHFLSKSYWATLAANLLDDLRQNWPLYVILVFSMLMMVRIQRNSRLYLCC